MLAAITGRMVRLDFGAPGGDPRGRHGRTLRREVVERHVESMGGIRPTPGCEQDLRPIEPCAAATREVLRGVGDVDRLPRKHFGAGEVTACGEDPRARAECLRLGVHVVLGRVLAYDLDELV